VKIIHDIYLFLNAIPLYALIFIGFGVFLFLLYMPWIRLFSKPIPFAGVKEEFPDGMTLEELSRIYLQPRGDGKDALNFDRDVDLGKNKVNEALKKEEQGRVDSKENIEEMVLSAGHGQEMHKEFT
jgi:hypothetical protein